MILQKMGLGLIAKGDEALSCNKCRPVLRWQIKYLPDNSAPGLKRRFHVKKSRRQYREV